MQATDLGNRNNRPRPERLNCPRKRRILAQREVRAGTLIVVEVQFQNAPQAGLILDDHVIQTFPTNRADQSLNVGVLPGRLRCRENFTNAQPACCLVKFLSVAPIPIAKQVMGGAVPRKSLQQLVSHPFTGTGRRRSCDRITKTNKTRKNTVGTTNKSQETISLLWFARNVRQVCEGGLR